MKTASSNLWNHLRKRHAEEYDQAVVDNKWDYTRTTDMNDASAHNASDAIRRVLPPFSPQVFLEYLVRFIVADDQVRLIALFLHTLTSRQSICVVECPEFRQVCMVLRETLSDHDIPCRDQVREAIISHWRRSFEDVRHELSVSSSVLSPNL